MKFALAFVAAAVVASAYASAAEPSTRPDSSFDKGTWNLSLTGSYIQPIRFSRDKFTNLNLSGGYYFWNNNSINLELQGYYDDRPDGAEAALLGGIGLLFRTHLYTHERWTIFMDGGGGVTYADHEVPQGGTNFNFTGKFGFGAGYELQDHTFLMAGARYFHLSNGQIRGRDDNPSYDGVQFWTGMMWTW